MFTAKEARATRIAYLAEITKKFQSDVSKYADEIENEIKQTCNIKTYIEYNLPRDYHEVIGVMFSDAGYNVTAFTAERDGYDDSVRIEW